MLLTEKLKKEMEKRPEGEFCPQYFKSVGYKMGDVYNAYLEMNLSDTPTREETAALAEASKPKAVEFTVLANADGVIEFTLPQSENQVDFIKIKI